MSFIDNSTRGGSSKERSEGSATAKAAVIVMDPRLSEGPKLHPDTQPGLALGNLVLSFTAPSTQGTINWHEWIEDNWVLLISQPNDFAPVCTTELALLAKLTPEFEKRSIKIAVVSANTVDEHLEWIRDVELSELSAGCPVTFPIISDPDRAVAETYGMLDPKEKARNGLPVTCRAVALIGPDKRLKLSMLYPVSTGRNLNEIIRIIDSIQIHKNHGVLTPVNWTPGEKCMVATEMDDETAKDKYGAITTTSMSSGKNYMRCVDDPSGVAKSEFSWKGLIKSVFGVGTGIVLGLLAGKYVKPLRERLT
eukprot:g7910.t1